MVKEGILAPEVCEREKEKFVQTMEEARKMAIESLREEFASMVERITDRFSVGPDGKPKAFKNATVDSFYEFFESFKQRNIFRDAELSELVERAKSVLGGQSAGEIRSDAERRERIRTGTETFVVTIKEGRGFFSLDNCQSLGFRSFLDPLILFPTSEGEVIDSLRQLQD